MVSSPELCECGPANGDRIGVDERTQVPKCYLCSDVHTNKKVGLPGTASFGTHHYRSSSKSVRLRYIRDTETLFRMEVNTLTPAEYLSCPMEKPTICIGENKDADQLRGNREADQRLCFRYKDSTIPLLLKSEISSF